MKPWNLILRAVIFVAVLYLSNVVVSVLPIPQIQTWGFILILIGIVSVLFILDEYLKYIRAHGNDKKLTETLPKVKNKTKLIFQAFIRYISKPLKFIALILSLISKPYNWRRICLKLFILVIIFFTLRISVSYFLDAKWDKPKNFSQVLHLNSLWGFQKEELSVYWQHFGNIKSQSDEPKTILKSIGYGDTVISLSDFEKHFFRLDPDTLPRNNLKMIIKPKDPGKNVRDSFEKFSIALTNQKKISSYWSPTIYPVQIFGKTRGSELQFKRCFNFRTRSLIEIILYYLFFLSFVIFAFYFINVPAIIRTLQEDTRISNLLKNIRRRLIKLLDNAMHLREPIPILIQSIEITLNAVIEIHKYSGRDDQPHLADKLNTAADSIVQCLNATDRLTNEVFQNVKGNINLIFDIVSEIHFRRVLVLTTKYEFEIFIYAIVKAGQNAESFQDTELEPTIKKQQYTLEQRCKELNKNRQKLRVAHEANVKIETQKIADAFSEELQSLRNTVEPYTDPRKLLELDKQVRQPGRLSIQNLDGGYQGGKIEFKIPEPVILSAQWKDNNVELSSMQSSFKAVAIPAENVHKELINIDYEVFMKTLKFKLNNIPQKLKPGTIKLFPKQKNLLKDLYDPLTVEEMKQQGLADITMNELYQDDDQTD